MADIGKILDKIDKLPALPASAGRIISMLTGKRADLAEISEVVRLDEALSMSVLRYGNSSHYGRPGREFNLKESIGRLGGNMMMKIVLQQKVGTLLEEGGVAFGLQRGALWRGALGGAFAAEHLGRRHCAEDHELCFLCGLLRDVGKLALDLCHGADYADRVASHLDESMTYVEAERLAFGTDHAEVGAELALRWQLPTRIADAIRFHHEPPAHEPEHDALFDIVHAADILCLWAGLAIGQDGLQYRLAPHVRKSLGLSRRDAEVEIAMLWSNVLEAEESMNMTEEAA